jgi:hypothetical protein
VTERGIFDYKKIYSKIGNKNSRLHLENKELVARVVLEQYICGPKYHVRLFVLSCWNNTCIHGKADENGQY